MNSASEFQNDLKNSNLSNVRISQNSNLDINYRPAETSE